MLPTSHPQGVVGLCTLMGGSLCSMAVPSSRTMQVDIEEPLYTYMNVFQVQPTQALHTVYETVCLTSLHWEHVIL